MRLFCTAFLVFFLKTTTSSLNNNVINNIQSFIQRNQHDDITRNVGQTVEKKVLKHFLRQQEDVSDVKKARDKSKILQKVRTHEVQLNKGADVLSSLNALNPKQRKQHYHMDPVLNQIRRRSRHKSQHHNDSTSDESSSLELLDWKDEFNDYWMQKKFEAINSTDVRGDVINMVAARPWGVPCGDPEQHDTPWGSCTLPMDCDSEYRIYRGDYFCGNTEFVCCALQLSTYDLNQGFDISFADSSFSTDSEERKTRGKSSKERRKRKKQRQKRKRQKERKKRKRQMKKTIRQIVREIRKILNRSFRNASIHRKKRTKLLKRYIKDLKKQYIKDRKSVREIHREDMIKIDDKLRERLYQVRDLNKNFMLNATFRNIINSGTMTRTGALMLVEAYPELADFLRIGLRRDGGGVPETNNKGDYLEYDIEYGELYY